MQTRRSPLDEISLRAQKLQAKNPRLTYQQAFTIILERSPKPYLAWKQQHAERVLASMNITTMPE